MRKKMTGQALSLCLACLMLITGILLAQPDSELLIHTPTGCKGAETETVLAVMHAQLKLVVSEEELFGNAGLHAAFQRLTGHRSGFEISPSLALTGVVPTVFPFCLAAEGGWQHPCPSSIYILNYIHDKDGRK